MTAESVATKTIKVSIELSDLGGELSASEMLGDQEKLARLTSFLNTRYRGAATNFKISLNGSLVNIVWQAPISSAAAEAENRAALLHLRGKEYRQAVDRWEHAIALNALDPDMQYNLGLTYLELRETQLGITRLLEAVRICPIYKRAYLVLGTVYSKMRQFEQAESYLKSCLQLDRNNISALVGLGAVMSITRRFDEAIRYFEKAISLSPKEIRAYFGLGKIYLAQSDTDNANRCFNAVVKLDPDGKLGHIAKQSIKIESTAQAENSAADSSGASIAGITDIQELYRIGYQNFIRGDLQEARTAYKKYLAMEGKDADVWATLSSCELRLGLMNEAVQSIKRAMAMSPNRASFYKQAAMLYDIRGNAAEAATAAQKAMDLGKTDSITLSLLGKNLAAQGNSQDGLKYLQEAVRQNPNNLNARYHFAHLLISLGQEEAGRQNLEEILWNKIDSPLKDRARQEIERLSR